MTVSSTVLKSGPYNTDGTTINFAITYQYLAQSDIVATLTNKVTGAQIVGVLTTDFTVVDNVLPVVGGTLTPTVGSFGGLANASKQIASGYTLTFTRNMSLTQPQAYPNAGLFPSAAAETGYDRLTLITQQFQNSLNQALQIPVSDSGINTILPLAALRAGFYLAFDSLGNPIAAAGPVSGTVISAAMIPVVQSATTFAAAQLLLNGNIASSAIGVTDTNVLEALTASVNSYAQSMIQNKSSGATASADLVVGNDVETSTTFYGNFGMNSSGYTGSGSFNKASAVYLTSTSCDLVIGTTTANAIRFVYNGGTTDAGYIDSTGWNFLTQSINQTNSVNGTTSIQINNTNAGASASSQLVLNNGTTLTQFVHTGASATTPNSFFISSGSSGERLRFDSSGRILLGGASVATGYTNAGDVTMGASNNIRAMNTAKAWVMFGGVTSISGVNGFNISSVVRNSTGVYIVNLTNALANVNYANVGLAGNLAAGGGTPTIGDRQVSSYAISTSQLGLVTGLTAAGTVFDTLYVGCAVFGN